MMTSRGDIEDFRDIVLAFFEETTPVAFGIPFESVSLIDLVSSPDVRSFLEKAAQSLETGRVVESLEHTAVAFAELLDNYERGYRKVFGVDPFDSPRCRPGTD